MKCASLPRRPRCVGIFRPALRILLRDHGSGDVTGRGARPAPAAGREDHDAFTSAQKIVACRSAKTRPNGVPAPGKSDDPPHLARALPALPRRLNLMAASRDDGTTLRDPSGTCLARYKVDHNILTFSLDAAALMIA